MKKLFLFIIFGFLFSISHNLFADKYKLVASFEIGQAEKENAENWYKGALLEAAQTLRRDHPNDIDMLKMANILDEKRMDYLQVFKKALDSNGNGITLLLVPMPFIEVVLPDTTVVTDTYGYFDADFSADSCPAKLYYKAYNPEDSTDTTKVYEPFYNKGLIIDKNDNYAVVTISFFANVQTPANFLSNCGCDTPENSSLFTDYFYPNLLMPDKIPWAKNLGSMYFVAKGPDEAVSGDIVNCNKANSQTDASNFPFNFSDCSISICLGTLYAFDPDVFGIFKNSYYCFLESVCELTHCPYKDLYCNGSLKPGGHYNCSWFTGIECAEELHTHVPPANDEYTTESKEKINQDNSCKCGNPRANMSKCRCGCCGTM